MENTKTSIFKRIVDFFKSFADSDYSSDGRVAVDSLSKEEQKELVQVLKESEGAVEKIEDSMKDKYKAKVDTRKAKVAAQNKEIEDVIGDKTRDNH